MIFFLDDYHREQARIELENACEALVNERNIAEKSNQELLQRRITADIIHNMNIGIKELDIEIEKIEKLKQPIIMFTGDNNKKNWR